LIVVTWSHLTRVPSRVYWVHFGFSITRIQIAEMASTPSTLKKEKKDESFLEKIGGTLARKKKAKEG